MHNCIEYAAAAAEDVVFHGINGVCSCSRGAGRSGPPLLGLRKKTVRSTDRSIGGLPAGDVLCRAAGSSPSPSLASWLCIASTS
ncbi:hypothetical protein DAI22_11g037500 [Oryza sativa Japonica Group]|nr:hypothetical protein DAI22_11g037500 [Oryza sativa Japonica Group]